MLVEPGARAGMAMRSFRFFLEAPRVYCRRTGPQKRQQRRGEGFERLVFDVMELEGDALLVPCQLDERPRSTVGGTVKARRGLQVRSVLFFDFGCLLFQLLRAIKK